MTSSSAGSRPSSEEFLSGFLEGLKKERIPGSGDTAMKGGSAMTSSVKSIEAF